MKGWECKGYEITANGEKRPANGIVFRGVLGVHFIGERLSVTHLASGLRVTVFRDLGLAVRFVEGIESLTDWSRHTVTGLTRTDLDVIRDRVHQMATVEASVVR